jgi:CheY-like chemotaxis protein
MAATPRVEAKTVLVADDTAFVRDRFKAAIEGAGHKALTAQTGPELLGRVRKDVDDLDLIVLDLRLPQGNGVALLRAIRKIAHEAPPVMVFSGTIASADEVRELGTLGVTGYVNEYMAVQHIVPALVPHLFPDRSNRRSSPRVVMGIPVAYRFGNTIAAALTLNISRGGLAIRTTSPLAVGHYREGALPAAGHQARRRHRRPDRVDRSSRGDGTAVHGPVSRRSGAHRRLHSGALLHES